MYNRKKLIFFNNVIKIDKMGLNKLSFPRKRAAYWLLFCVGIRSLLEGE